MSQAPDPRVTPANGRVAHLSLRGAVAADRYVAGDPARVAHPLADILSEPGGRRQRQALRGDRVLVLERRDGWAFVQSSRDGYCGYLPEAALGPDRQATHWVAAPATHLYPSPDIRAPEIASLSLGARLSIVETSGRFSRTDAGEFVPEPHLRPIGTWATDPAAVAESLLGTPYLWGGNSRSGLDCSGLVQTALSACGLSCPGDSDLQERALGRPLAAEEQVRRNDLLFWKGHVAMVLGEAHIIHATGHAMSVIVESLPGALARIESSGGGRPTSRRRL